MTRDETVLSLHRQGLSQRAIARQLGISQVAICKRLRKLRRLGLIPSPTENLAGASPTEGRDNHNASQRANGSATSSQAHTPVSGEPLVARVLGSGRPDNTPHDRDNPTPLPGDNHPTQGRGMEQRANPHLLPQAARLQGSLNKTGTMCGICGGRFAPQMYGQKYCCNACGAKAAGLRPVVDHATGCTLVDENGDNR
jgi:hypothetical protein